MEHSEAFHVMQELHVMGSISLSAKGPSIALYVQRVFLKYTCSMRQLPKCVDRLDLEALGQERVHYPASLLAYTA